MSFGPALAVGIEGEAELLDFETSVPLDPKEAVVRLNAMLPAGLRVREVRPLPPGGASLSARINLGEYRAWIDEGRRRLLPEEFASLDPNCFHDAAEQRRRAESLLARERLPVQRRVKGVVKEIDIRPFIRGIDYLPDRGEQTLWLRLGPQGQARPQEVLELLHGVPGTCFRLRRQALLVEREPSSACIPEPALA